ncbi:MAG: DUF927 domain-containing protein [Sphingobium sp.]
MADAINIAAVREAKLPAGFVSKPGGIFYSDEENSPVWICSPVRFLAQTRDDRGSAWGLLLSWQDQDGREHRWAMQKAMLAGDGSEIRANLLDRGMRLGTSHKARTKLLDLLATVAIKGRAMAVDRVGWAEGAFVLPEISYGDRPQNRVIYQGPAQFDHPYRATGTLADWQHLVARYGAGNSRIAVALASAFVGPLLDLLGEDGGGINFRGPSSIGKSTALFAAASVWGAPSFVRQWRSTANGLEGVAVQHSETLLCLDELAQLDPKEAGSVAYMLANGVGKARAGRSGALRAPTRWRAFFLSSGEISLADLAGRDGRGARRSAAGQEIRILDIEADAGAGLGLFNTLHDALNGGALSQRIREGAATVYGVAGPCFVEMIAADRENYARHLKATVKAFTEQNVPVDANGQVARACRRLAVIAAAGELARHLDILPWKKGEAWQAAAVVFQAWLAGRGGVGAAEDTEAVSRVRAFLELHGASRFEPMDRGEAPEQRTISRAGFWRTNEAGLREHFILPEVWRNEVCAGSDATRIARVLAAKDMLRAAGDKYSISQRCPGIGKTRVYAVLPSIFGEEE